MTEQQASPEEQEQPALQAGTENKPQPAPETKPPRQPPLARRKSNGLAILALVLIAATGGSLYAYTNWQAQQQQATSHQLEVKLGQLEALQGPLQQQQTQNQQVLQQVQQGQLQAVERQAQLEKKLLELDSRRPNDWLLAEADYLVRMAGRKLWLEHDYAAALLLLGNADERIRDLNDPSLIPLRHSLAEDMAKLQGLPQIDREGLVLRLGALIDNVDQLVIKGLTPPPAVMVTDTALSETLDDWRDNLQKSLKSFADNFITIRRRDGQTEALIAPQQSWYLKENLKSRLLQAQLAVYREQQGVYDDSLQKVAQWLEQYMDANDSTTQYMQKELDKLQEQTIAVDYPRQFASQPALEELMKHRVQRLLAPQ